jgi:hypothetical protein
MGTWGPGILDSDLALDVKHAFRQRVAAGADGALAVRELVRAWRSGFDDREDGAAMWLALADVAWDAGRLPPSLGRRALAIARSRSALEPFELGGLGAERRAVLARFAAKLVKPPPAPKRIALSKQRTTELAVGDLVVYTLPTGHKALLWVVRVSVDKGGATPVLELLDFVGKRVPTAAELRARELAARLTRIAYDPWGRLPAWFYVLDLARRIDPGQRYFIWPEKYAPKRKLVDGMGPLTRLGAPLEALLAAELGIARSRRK